MCRCFLGPAENADTLKLLISRHCCSDFNTSHLSCHSKILQKAKIFTFLGEITNNIDITIVLQQRSIEIIVIWCCT